MIPGVQVVHATSVEAPVGLLAVHGHRVPVLARPEAETGEAGKWGHGWTRGIPAMLRPFIDMESV